MFQADRREDLGSITALSSRRDMGIVGIIQQIELLCVFNTTV